MEPKEIKSYQSVKKTSKTEEIIINKSRFIGYATHAMTEDNAKKFIDEVTDAHPEASCICHAYICGMNAQVQKFFDGHEPVGGMPILDVLKLKKLTATCCVVVRYFGGMKLGRNGLARAFSNTASHAINLARPSIYELSTKFILTVDYTFQGKLEYMLKNSVFEVGTTEFGEKISMEITAKKDKQDELDSRISAITNGNHSLKAESELYKCWAD